jgi:xylulose-5-phosphate/fructose-6-phosphate phosphoketolase
MPQKKPWASMDESTARRDKLIEHKQYICRHVDDLPEISDGSWGRQEKASGPRGSATAADNV